MSHPIENEPASHKLSASHRPDSRETVIATVALLALGIISVLALFAPAEKLTLSDKLGLLFLGASTATLLWPPLARLLEAQPGGSTFVVTVAMFVIHSIARRWVPEHGWSMRFAAVPEDEYILPYAAYVAVLGAFFTAPFWWRRSNQWTRALLSALSLLVVLATFSFWLLGHYYPVGPTQRVDPAPMPSLAFLLIEYSCVALLCRAVCVNVRTRRLALKVLPLLLLVLWARFQFIVPPEDAE
jgi:hypothetical protein